MRYHSRTAYVSRSCDGSDLGMQRSTTAFVDYLVGARCRNLTDDLPFAELHHAADEVNNQPVGMARNRDLAISQARSGSAEPGCPSPGERGGLFRVPPGDPARSKRTTVCGITVPARGCSEPTAGTRKGLRTWQRRRTPSSEIWPTDDLSAGSVRWLSRWGPA